MPGQTLNMTGSRLAQDLVNRFVRKNDIPKTRPQPREDVRLWGASSLWRRGWQDAREEPASLCHLNRFPGLDPTGNARK